MRVVWRAVVFSAPILAQQSRVAGFMALCYPAPVKRGLLRQEDDESMLVDTHAHLDDAKFASDIDAVLDRARAAGVCRIITVGTGVESSQAAVRLAQSRPGVIFACVGIHPHEADNADEAALEAIAELAGVPGVVGIGESGLDYHYNNSSREGQRRAFIWQIELSIRRGLPLVLHCRDAFEDAIAALTPYRGKIRGVAHCFSGGPDEAKALLGLGLHLSFAGPLTFPKSEALREAVAVVPLERLLIETDCPYLSPVPWRGRRNEPANLTATADALVRLRGALAKEAVTRNAESLFGLSSRDEGR